MWACEHLSLYDRKQPGPRDVFPRVWKCLTIVLEKKKISKAFNHSRTLVSNDFKLYGDLDLFTSYFDFSMKYIYALCIWNEFICCVNIR